MLDVRLNIPILIMFAHLILVFVVLVIELFLAFPHYFLLLESSESVVVIIDNVVVVL